ncbi:protein-tyrosine-phosphatase, partial [Streptomyces seoulensis]
TFEETAAEHLADRSPGLLDALDPASVAAAAGAGGGPAPASVLAALDEADRGLGALAVAADARRVHWESARRALDDAVSALIHRS